MTSLLPFVIENSDVVRGVRLTPTLSARMTQMGVDPASLSAKQYLDILEKGYIEMGRAIKAAIIPRISG